MYNHYTHQDLTRAIIDPTMSSLQRYSILSYFGYQQHEIKQVYYDLDIMNNNTKNQVESIVNTTINNILNRF